MLCVLLKSIDSMTLTLYESKLSNLIVKGNATVVYIVKYI